MKIRLEEVFMKINKKNVNKLKNRIKATRQELESNQLRAIKKMITKNRIEDICCEEDYQYRERILTPTATILHMIGAALSREGSFQSSWHNIGQTGQSDILSKARKRLPAKIWNNLNQWINKKIDKEFGEEAKWRGHRVIGVDGTCVSMSDEAELSERYGKSKSKFGLSRFPIAQMVFAFTLKTRVTVAHQIGAYKLSEQELLRRMYAQMNGGDLIIGDRHFAGANLYVEYQQYGLEFITRTHQRLKVGRLKRVKEYSKKDFIVKLPLTLKHRRKNKDLPEYVLVRILEVRAKLRGKMEQLWLVTSLLDAKKYPGNDVKDLYRKRWTVETLIEEQKIWLGSDVLRSKTAKGISKEIYARIIAGNLIHWLILKAARKHKIAAKQISTSAATRLISHYSIRMGDASKKRLGDLYEKLLDKIAGSIIPYRPNRLEPRLKKRDQKHYSILHASRAQWRKDNDINP